MKPFLTIVLISITCFEMTVSCNESVELEQDLGYDFMPLIPGMERIYSVEEIIISGSLADTSTYYLKERIGDTINVIGDYPTYALERFKATDTAGIWERDSIWTIRKNDFQGIYAENNVAFIKLTFPVKADGEWDGNALNIRDEEIYRYQSIPSQTFAGSEISGSDLIKVVMSDIPPNLVSQDQRSEIFIRGIGLAVKNYISVEFCQNSDGCDGINEGRVLHQVLVSYGKE